MADILPIRPKQHRDLPDELIRNFCDWLDHGSFFKMKAIVRITSCDIHEVSGHQTDNVGFEVQATALARMPSGCPEPIHLYFHTTESMAHNLMSNKWQVGSYVIVKGEYSLLINDSPPSLTLYIDSVDDVMPVPEEYLPVAQYWLADSE